MRVAAEDEAEEDEPYLVVQPGGRRRGDVPPHGGQGVRTPKLVARKVTTAAGDHARKTKRTLPAVVSDIPLVVVMPACLVMRTPCLVLKALHAHLVPAVPAFCCNAIPNSVYSLQHPGNSSSGQEF